MNLAYLHIMEAMESDLKAGPSIPTWEALPVSFFRPLFRGTLITNGGFTRDKASAYIAEGHCDAVAFGVPFIANPDLPARFQKNAPLAAADPSTFYMGGEKGYAAYPALAL
jgi:N-ethylmaleimide reductase